MSLIDRAEEGQAGYGDTVIVLTGELDPPTNDHLRAVQALTAEKGNFHVWVAPLSSLSGGDEARDAHVRNLTTIFCSELSASAGIRVTACLVALDKKIRRGEDLAAKCRAMFPYLRFKFACLNYDHLVSTGIEDYVVGVGRQPSFYSPMFGEFKGKHVQVDKFLPVGRGSEVRQAIRDGKDESRNMLSTVWDYVQKNRLYRS